MQSFRIQNGEVEDNGKISIKDGKYVVDATIHTEISTSNIAEVQESFAVDCAVEFAEAIRKWSSIMKCL